MKKRRPETIPENEKKDLTWEIIQHYVKNENTSGMALLLDGEWGSGKSYYVNHELKEKICELHDEKNKNTKFKCVLVSLYGITDVSQISVQLYTALRSIKVFKGEAVQTASIVVGHIFSGFMPKQGWAFSNISDKEFKKLFESMNTKNVLIVFDDVERCMVNIIEVLAYVNHLCEQGKAKVLLVANEKELLQYIKDGKSYRIPHMTEQQRKKDELRKSVAGLSHERLEPTVTTKDYLRMKEKTIGDTIRFSIDYKIVIYSIIHRYNVFEKMMKTSGKDRVIDYINFLMEKLEIYNMRSLEYACDKINALVEENEFSFVDMDEFYYNVVFGALCFILLGRMNGYDEWKSTGSYPQISVSVCQNEFPLPRFVYNYLIIQSIDDIDGKFIDDYNSFCNSHKSDICMKRFWKANDT